MNEKDLPMNIRKRMVEHARFYEDKARHMRALSKILPTLDDDEVRLVKAALKDWTR